MGQLTTKNIALNWALIVLVFQDFAVEVIKSTHNFWKALISQKANAGELNW